MACIQGPAVKSTGNKHARQGSQSHHKKLLCHENNWTGFMKVFKLDRAQLVHNGQWMQTIRLVASLRVSFDTPGLAGQQPLFDSWIDCLWNLTKHSKKHSEFQRVYGLRDHHTTKLPTVCFRVSVWKRQVWSEDTEHFNSRWQNWRQSFFFFDGELKTVKSRGSRWRNGFQFNWMDEWIERDHGPVCGAIHGLNLRPTQNSPQVTANSPTVGGRKRILRAPTGSKTTVGWRRTCG